MFSNDKRLRKNILSGVSSQSFKILTQIFYPPLMIMFWGIENFGIWIFLISLPNIIQIFNLNLTDASINQMAIYNARKEFNKSNEIFQNTIIFTLLNILFFSVLIFLFFKFNSTEFSVLKKLDTQNLKLILGLIFASIYLKFFESIFNTNLYSLGKINIGYNLETFYDLFSKIFIIIAGIFYNSLIVAALIIFILSMLKFIIKFFLFLKYKKKLKFSLGLVSTRVIIRLIRLSIGHMSDIGSNIIKSSGVIFILGIFLNPYMLGYISTVKTLFYFMPVNFFGKVSFAINFELSNLFGVRRFNQIKDILKKYFKIILFLMVLYIAVSFILGPFIYQYWINNKYEINKLFLLLILLDTSLYILRNTIISPFVAINKNSNLGISDLLFSILAILLFFLSFEIGKDYIFAFGIITIFSLLSLIYSAFYLTFNLKKIKLK